MGRRYGLPADCYGLATDSKVVDVQWALERTINAFLGAAGRPAFLSGTGLTQSGLAASVDVLPLDDEISRASRGRFIRRPPAKRSSTRRTSRRAPPLGWASSGSRETRRLMRAEFYLPRLTFRGTLEQWNAEGARDLLDASAARAAELGARDPIGLADGTAADMAALIGRAALEMELPTPPTCAVSSRRPRCRMAEMLEGRFHTIIEPFRIKVVEPIRFTTRGAERHGAWRRPATTCSASGPRTC